MVAMLVSTGGPLFTPSVQAQIAPVGAGFVLNAGDLRFIFHQIEIAEAHAAGGQLLGPGVNQVREERLPFGLRTVDGSFNHLSAGRTGFGAADRVFPRLTQPHFRPAQQGTSYTQKTGSVVDAKPRVISNLVIDQTASNPAALAVATAQTNEEPVADPLGTLPIGNVAPDVGLSAPFNSMFTFFGQFFDHGLDLVTKGGGTVFVPLQPDDALFVPGSSTNFMALTRATNQPGPNGILGDDDDVQEGTNTTTPFVDQNQTYTSHPSHQVFLREYEMQVPTGGGPARPLSTGRMIDGGGSIGGVPVRNIGNWGEVKAQARTMLGIALADIDVFNVPLLATDPYGRFLRGPNGFPLMMMANNTVVEGNPAAPITTVSSRKTGHGFLDDIAHAANPSVAGYNQALLEAHFVTGDGRGNENIALTAVHTVFHLEHNRLREYMDVSINDPAFGLTAAERAAWHADAPQPPAGSGWTYGERLFQAARFATEMQYQHLVFEEFARKISPSINPFIGDGINFVANINPAISAEFAHQVYRLGHSMLTETIERVNTNGSVNNISLLDAFLNPLAFNNGGPAGTLTAAQAAGSIFTGMTRQVGNEIDEFVTEAVRSRLVGLPLDLAVLNIARGRSEGVASLNSVRRQLFQASGDFALVPYDSWFDFGFGIKHPESLVNFIAAYGQHPTLTDPASPAAPLTVAQRRAAAQALLNDANFMFAPASQSGLDDVDLWMGGLAEKQTPFGGLLGTTMNYVFEMQLESLQNADRFYYLERLDGLNFLSQLEANSFVELVQRNTTLNGAAGADVFARPDLVINLSFQPLTGPAVDDPNTPDFNEAVELVRMPNGTLRYAGPAHVIWNGRNDGNGDRIHSSEGDDTLRGNGGNDVMEGGPGNDQHIGGAGDDILTDTFGDDVMKGGPGNDAISGGAGPFDLLQGNEGNDFIVAGPDLSEIFGGPGQDIFYMGKGLSESIGGAGDDWIEGTESPASIAIGDDNNQFQNDPNGGHDIALAGLGDMDFDMEGGDDIMVGTVIPTHRFEGMLGFDWATYRGETIAVDADMLVTGAIAVNAPLNENRDRYDLIEGLSGTNFNDLLAGDNRTAADLANDGLTGVANGHVLNAAGIARISGLAAILPAGATTWGDGNIILGGPGSDRIEGRGGDDILDGDRWLNVQLMAPNPAGGPALLANSLHELKADVFAGRINPGSITFVRSIVATGSTPQDIDTAVFTGPRADYTVTVNGGVVTVTDNVGTDGTDTLRNIERLQFADVNVASGAGTVGVTVPNVVNQLQANAVANLAARGLGFALATANSGTIAVGRVISQTPAANTQVTAGSTVGLVISLGPLTVTVPNVVGSTQAGATTALTGLGLTVSTTTASSNTVPFGSVISQTPVAGATAIVPSNVALVISAGVSTGLVAAFGFEEQTGTVAIDSSPLPRNGTVAGGAVRVATGKIGRAIQFDGVNDAVNIIDGAAGTKLDLTTGMTIEAWVNPSAQAGWETVVYKERGADGTGLLSYALYSHDGAPQAGGLVGPAGYIRIGTADQAVRRTPATALPLNVWTHLATTYDGLTQRLFVNGVQVSSVARTGTIVAGNQPLRIGASNAQIAEFFNGLIDEVRIYNRALTAAEITADMNAPVVQ